MQIISAKIPGVAPGILVVDVKSLREFGVVSEVLESSLTHLIVKVSAPKSVMDELRKLLEAAFVEAS